MAKTYEEDPDIRFGNIVDDPEGGVIADIPLQNRPEFAARIGLFLALFTTAELTTATVLARLLSITEREAQIILEPISSYSIRLSVLESLAKIHTHPQQAFFAQFVTEMRWLNAERNSYVHSQYGIGKETGKFYRGSWLTDRRDSQWKILTIDDLQADIRRARKFVALIWDELRER